MNERPLTDKQQKILDTYRSIVATTGRTPKMLEIADAARIDGKNNNSRQAGVAAKLQVLRERGLLTGGAPKPPPPPMGLNVTREPSPPPAPKKKRKKPAPIDYSILASPKKKAKPKAKAKLLVRLSTGNPAIDTLLAKKAKLASAIEKIDQIVTLLEGMGDL